MKKEIKSLNSVKNQYVAKVKKVCYSPFVNMIYDSNFLFILFSAAVKVSIISLDQFLSFTGNLMLEYFKTFLGKISLDIMGGW